MIKLIASDMDGTLFGAKMNISESNVAAIEEANRRGIVFMVATGRGHAEAKPALDEAGIVCSMINVNGAQAFDEKGQVLFTIGIEKENARKVIEILESRGLYFEMATNQGIYSNSQANRLENTAAYLANQLEHLTFKMALAMAAAHIEMLHINYVKNYDTLLDNDQLEVLKFIVFSQEGPKVLKPTAEELENLADVIVTSSHTTNIEINHKSAQKGYAVERIAKQMGIPLSQVMTIGDNLNDISMLKIAGVSFAMGNGEKRVKEVAKYETATNLENGVGEAIMRAINENL